MGCTHSDTAASGKADGHPRAEEKGKQSDYGHIPRTRVSSDASVASAMSEGKSEAEKSKERRSHQHVLQNVVLEEFQRGEHSAKLCLIGLSFDFRKDINDYYNIFSSDILGSGCTGSVISCTNKKVSSLGCFSVLFYQNTV